MKRILLFALFGIFTVSMVALAFPILPYTTYDNLKVREWFSVGAVSNNVYTNPVFGPNSTAYIQIAGDSTVSYNYVSPTVSYYSVTNVCNNGRITPNRTYNVLNISAGSIISANASTLNYIAPTYASNGDILILEGPTTQSVVIMPYTPTWATMAPTHNLRLACTTPSYTYTMTNNMQTLTLIYNEGYWKEITHSFNQ